MLAPFFRMRLPMSKIFFLASASVSYLCCDSFNVAAVVTQAAAAAIENSLIIFNIMNKVI